MTISEWQIGMSYDEEREVAAGYAAHFEKFGDCWVDALLQWPEYVQVVNDFLAKCGSPIERRLILAFAKQSPPLVGIAMYTQQPVGKYTADIVFASLAAGDHDWLIAIECDGAKFHQNNPAQVASDKRRDRFFLAEGIATIRYTGSEIFRGADACAAEALSLYYRLEAARRPAA